MGLEGAVVGEVGPLLLLVEAGVLVRALPTSEGRAVSEQMPDCG